MNGAIQTFPNLSDKPRCGIDDLGEHENGAPKKLHHVPLTERAQAFIREHKLTEKPRWQHFQATAAEKQGMFQGKIVQGWQLSFTEMLAASREFDQKGIPKTNKTPAVEEMRITKPTPVVTATITPITASAPAPKPQVCKMPKGVECTDERVTDAPASFVLKTGDELFEAFHCCAFHLELAATFLDKKDEKYRFFTVETAERRAAFKTRTLVDRNKLAPLFKDANMIVHPTAQDESEISAFVEAIAMARAEAQAEAQRIAEKKAADEKAEREARELAELEAQIAVEEALKAQDNQPAQPIVKTPVETPEMSLTPPENGSGQHHASPDAMPAPATAEVISQMTIDEAMNPDMPAETN